MSNCLLCHEEVSGAYGWSAFLGLKKEEPLCQECKRSFIRIEGEVCRICGRVWTEVMEEHRRGEICLDCRKWEQDPDSTGLLRMNRSVYQYDEQMQEVLARYKFRGDAVICSAFEAEFREVYDLFYKKGNLLLVPIPLSGERLYERGFNQSLLLAELLKERVVQPLSKTETEKQSKKTRRDRLQRENSFHVSEPELVRGKDVLLIDDIYTTGTTLRMAAIRLRQAGAGEISALTLVRS